MGHVPANVTTLGGNVEVVPGAENASYATGELGAVNDMVALANLPWNASAWNVQVAGTFVGELAFEASLDGEHWYATLGRSSGLSGQIHSTVSRAGPIVDMFRGNLAGYRHFRVRMTKRTSGSASVILGAGGNLGSTFHSAQLPRGQEIIGAVTDPLLYYVTAIGGFMGFNATVLTSAPSKEAGEFDMVLFANPVDSHRDVRIYKVSLSTDVPGIIRRYRSATTSSRGTTAVAINRGGGSDPATGQLYARDQFAISARGIAGRTEFIAANDPHDDPINGTLLMPPGGAFLWTYERPVKGVETPRLAAEIVWWEERLS